MICEEIVLKLNGTCWGISEADSFIHDWWSSRNQTLLSIRCCQFPPRLFKQHQVWLLFCFFWHFIQTSSCWPVRNYWGWELEGLWAEAASKWLQGLIKAEHRAPLCGRQTEQERDGGGDKTDPATLLSADQEAEGFRHESPPALLHAGQVQTFASTSLDPGVSKSRTTPKQNHSSRSIHSFVGLSSCLVARETSLAGSPRGDRTASTGSQCWA